MSQPKMRIGLIGAGAIAQTHAQVLAQSATAELVGVCDVRTHAAEALAEQARCPAFEAYQDLVEATGCRAAIVCTPPVTHSEICRWLLAHGIHVLCEKPLAIGLREARGMVAAAEQSEATLAWVRWSNCRLSKVAACKTFPWKTRCGCLSAAPRASWGASTFRGA